jgi:hypothetical protein
MSGLRCAHCSEAARRKITKVLPPTRDQSQRTKTLKWAQAFGVLNGILHCFWNALYIYTRVGEWNANKGHQAFHRGAW